jgi:glucosyl-dolichyl phosphate glucuronosyltransferase
MELSIIICTYNRSAILANCIESLLKQLDTSVELIIIDNNSNDDTALICSKYTTKCQNIKYFIEHHVGHSYARNRGVKESTSDWLLYLDDDTLVFENFISRAKYLTNLNAFDCVGGNYIAHAGENLMPKWIPNTFENYNGNLTELTECDYRIPIGCNVLYKKKSIESVGLFDPMYGMKGIVNGYGDETELQFRLQNSGYKIAFDPLLRVYHVIREDKLKLIWHLKSVLKKGYYSYKLKNNYKLTIVALQLFKSIIGLFFRRLPVNFYKKLTKKDYYWQNLIYDSIMPNLLYLGQVLCILKVKL